MVRSTAGAELCALPGNTNPMPSDCVTAVDRTYKGDVDLSDRVVVGQPIQKSPLQWSVPYDVIDEAGNAAVTVWRDVVVQEVDLASVENLIRAEVSREQEAAQQKAVQKAVREERAKWDREQQANNNRNKRSNSAKSCPACPPCDCPDTPETTRESCSQYCENISKSCSLSDGSKLYSMLFWMEEYLTPSLIPSILFVALIFVVFLGVRFILTTIYNPRAYQNHSYPSNYGPMNNEDIMILRSPQPMMGSSPAPPPRQSLQFGSPAGVQQPSFASPSFPPSNGAPNRPAAPMYDESIYMSPPLITPSKTGDGARRRNL
jgi:hypothetical protein